MGKKKGKKERHTYQVEVLAEEDGPPAQLRERFAVCAARRFPQVEEADGYPVAGGWLTILDAFEGPYAWEMTDEQLEATPPTMVELEIVSVTPEEPPEPGTPVSVVLRVPF